MSFWRSFSISISLVIALCCGSLAQASLACYQTFSESAEFIYDRVYIQFYGLEEMGNYLDKIVPVLESADYELTQIGESIEGRPLHKIAPKKIIEGKKTIVLLSRQHGDEGTANWILEGFLNDFFARGLHEEYQLIVYPMINPDGVVARTRENANGWDLNRVWNVNGIGRDEIRYIHGDFKEMMDIVGNDVLVVQDLHGSFVRDFIYRVGENFKGPDFFAEQGRFIESYGTRDQWQAGESDISNGRPGMARIVMISQYGLNAMTHETPRDIRLSTGRTKETLMSQGVAILDTILAEYGDSGIILQ